MKLKYIFTAIASAALVAVGCTEKYEISSLDEIQLSKTFISIPMEGGSVSVDLNAATDWEFAKIFEVNVYDDEGNKVKDENGDYVMESVALPDWLEATPLSGKAGEVKLTFTAGKVDAGRETQLIINAGGKKQNLTVRQGEIAASTATCADVIAAPDGKTFIVTGTCTSIANTVYGNWYLNDGTGEIYIYGTVDATGKYNWAGFNIEVGDEVTVKGSKVTYNGIVEFIDAKVVSVKKSLLKCTTPELSVTKAGGEVIAKFIVKGDGLVFNVPAEVSAWANVVNIKTIKASDSENPDTTAVTILVQENAGLARSGNIEFTSSSSAGKSSATVKVNQSGPSYIYEKATAVTSGKKYLMVTDGGAFTLLEGKTYGYPENTPVTVEDGSIELFSDELAFVFTSKDSGYTIMSTNGDYIYQSGTYDSFNWGSDPKSGDVWNVEAQADGTFKITNASVNKWIQYSSNYSSWGSYNTEKGAMPELYELVSEE